MAALVLALLFFRVRTRLTSELASTESCDLSPAPGFDDDPAPLGVLLLRKPDRIKVGAVVASATKLAAESCDSPPATVAVASG